MVCATVCEGCIFDISKCFKDGKPLIIDGTHIDPEMFLTKSSEGEFRILTPVTSTNTAVHEM
jgi:2-phosphoglycerate kinase